MDGWDNFFVAQAGAAVAFAGLVLVSISINLGKILQGRGLIGRSVEPLIVLFTLFVASSLMLIPDQAMWVYGAEILATGLVFSVVTATNLRIQQRILRAPDNPTPPPAYSFGSRIVLCTLVALAMVAAGMTIGLGHERGVYLLVPAMICGFLLSFIDAWVLLIEIDR